MSIQLQEIKNMYFPIQRIEYLESTEDYMQYIDTGVEIDSETAFQGSTIDFQCLTLGANNSVVVAGSVLGEGTHMYENTECLVYNGEFYKNGGFYFSQYSDIYARTTATSNGEAKGISNLNLILFARNVKGHGIVRMINGQRGGTFRIFSCTIRKNGDVIRDFIPVRIGTKGYMLDKVSGELYGNSGTGDFVLGQDVDSGLQQIYQNRLIEGVDYETYDWLKANIPLNVKMMELPVNSNNVEYDLQRLAHGNTTIFKTKNDEYKYFFWQFGYTIGVYDLKGSRDITSKNYDSTISLFHIKTTSNSVAFNSVSIGAFGLPITNILWHVDYGSANDTTKTSSIKVDGVTRYVPCQLLRSIPRNLDAQCKERVAGECGMIDLISGKFYGNVASSGTFTVENDNNE